MSPLRSSVISPHHLPEFIPELRLRDKYCLSAFRKATVSPKPVIVNFCELMQMGKIPARAAALKHALGGVSPLIISAVGRDELLDKFDVRQYHKTAVELGADWVISPDDYVYETDSGYSFYQNAHFSRALRRTLALTRLASGKSRVVGLVIGSNSYQLREFVRVVGEQGIDTFAYPCGDLLKRPMNLRRVINQISELVLYLKDSGYRSLLLGIDSPRQLRRLRPDMWASSGWSFDALHGLCYSSDGRTVRGEEPRCRHKECASPHLSPVERLTLHNLIVRANFPWKESLQ